MLFCDFSPPANPTLDEQRDALSKGLGRVHSWATAGRLDGDLLLAACLTDQRYDTQLDTCRGDWLWRLCQTTGQTERLRGPLLDALDDLGDGENAEQWCELARRFAAAGDEPFRTRLYEIVATKPVGQRPWLGESELIELDGGAGFLFAAGIRGRDYVEDGYRWDDDGLTRQAERFLGEDRVGELLAASTDADIRRFHEGWLAEKSRKWPPATDRAAEMRAIPVDEVIRRAGVDSGRYWFRRWGREADPAGLRVAYDCLESCQVPLVLANLLRVFGDRALPEFHPRLLELARHDNDDVRICALAALEHLTHPAVRDFALQQLPTDPSAVGLFINNFAPGDEGRIIDTLALPENECAKHSVLSDVVRILEANPDAAPSRLGLAVYALTPCGHCRADATAVLRDRGAAPEWLRGECMDDADDRCRDLFAGALPV